MTPRTAAGPRTKARLAYEEAWQNGYEAGKAEAAPLRDALEGALRNDAEWWITARRALDEVEG